MENILRDIPNLRFRVDDILLAGKTRAEHLKILRDVLQRLKDAGARLKKRKCVFLAPEVMHLGLKIDHNSIHPVPEKVRPLRKCHDQQMLSSSKLTWAW